MNNQPAKLIGKEKKEYSNREEVEHALQNTLLSTVSRTASENLQCRTQTLSTLDRNTAKATLLAARGCLRGFTGETAIIHLGKV